MTHRGMMVCVVPAALLLMVVGCGNDKGAQKPAQPASTPYGTVEEVAHYLEQINPYIQTVSSLQAHVEKQVGSSGRATADNLAKAMRDVQPQLQQAIDEFGRIQPPGLLANFHARIARLMATRMEAYALTIRGQESAQAADQPAWHAQVEAKLEEANTLISQLNEEMHRINDALQASVAAPTRVASP